mmetsp:Transcript_65520/g.80230  ORF Transcript_65520/g.80230 Transcript_65520/m.80230 type:complete len:216 (+) Transcript_65520:721-1368(+)
MTHLGPSSTHRRTPTIVLASYFKKLDTDSDGKVNESEFDSYMYELNVQNCDMDTLFKYADKNNDNYIEFNEFRSLIKVNSLDRLLNTQEDLESLTETYNVFKKYDVNGDGVISWNDFWIYLNRNGMKAQQISDLWHHMNGKYIHGKDATAKDVLTLEKFWPAWKTLISKKPKSKGKHTKSKVQQNKVIIKQAKNKLNKKKLCPNKSVKTNNDNIE